MAPLLLLSLLASPITARGAGAVSRCEQIRAEFREMELLSPKACSESKEVHARYQKSFLEVQEICRRLESRALNGAPKLQPGTAEERGREASSFKQADMQERLTLSQRVPHELLSTPIDTDSPARPPAEVSDACRDELDAYAKIRRVVLTAFNRFFSQIDQQDDQLFALAYEQASPATAARSPSSPSPSSP